MRLLKIAAMVFSIIGGSLAISGAPASAAPAGDGAPEAAAALAGKAEWAYHRGYYRPHRHYGYYRPYRRYGYYHRPYRRHFYRPYRPFPVYGYYRPYRPLPVYGYYRPVRCGIRYTPWGPRKVCRSW